MHQICKVKESKQQEGQTSFPVLLVDGTGSMHYEYKHVVEQWRKVFGAFGHNKLEFQWENGLFSLDQEFRSAGWGDITKAFQEVFDILLSKQFPSNITIIFVSDGQERFELSQLAQKIKQVTDKYIIQFISLAIGSAFPNDISNNLYLQLHNSHRSYVPMYQRERKYDSNIEEMQKYFFDTFEKIKNQLNFCSEVYECDKKVRLNFISEPTTRVTSGALFLTDQGEVRINGEVVQPTNSVEDKKAMIVNSVQQALVNYGSNQNEQAAIQNFATIKELSEQIYQPEKIETDQSFLAVQELVEQVTDKEVQLSLLTAEKLTKLQSNLDNAEKLTQVVQSVSVAEDPNNLEERVILKSFKKKVAACFVRGKSFVKKQQNIQINEQQCVAEIIKQTNVVVRDTLQKYINKLEKEKPQDCKQLIKEFYDVIQIKLNEFDKLDPGSISDEIIDESNILNSLLETLVLLDKEKQLSWEHASQKIKSALDGKEITQSTDKSMAITESQDDYKYLPFFQQGKNDEDWESVLFTIIDCNEKMKEQTLALNIYNETFADIDQEKVIQLFWKNQAFTVDGETFQKLIDVLKKFETSHKLREKKIFIAIVSDGQTDYKSLHKNFKTAKSNFCNIRFIYVAIGLNFKVALENDLSRKFHNRDVKGKPTIYQIPRQQFTQSVNNDKVVKPFQKAFEEIKDKLFKEKEKAPQRLSQVFQSQASIRKSVAGNQENNQQQFQTSQEHEQQQQKQQEQIDASNVY